MAMSLKSKCMLDKSNTYCGTDKGVDRISGVESVASPIGKYLHFL